MHYPSGNYRDLLLSVGNTLKIPLNQRVRVDRFQTSNDAGVRGDCFGRLWIASPHLVAFLTPELACRMVVHCDKGFIL